MKNFCKGDIKKNYSAPKSDAMTLVSEYRLCNNSPEDFGGDDEEV